MIKTLILLIFSCCLSLVSFTQELENDGFQRDLQGLDLNDSLAIDHIQERIDTSDLSEDHQSKLLLDLGILLVNNYQYEKADKVLTSSLSKATNTAVIAEVNFQSGLSLMYRDIRLRSLSYLRDAYDGFEQISDSLGMGKSLDKIADNYNYFGKHDTARPFYDQCIEIFTAIKDTSRLTNVLGNIGGMMSEENQNDSALFYYKKAMFLNEQMGNMSNLSSDLSGMGIALDELGREDEALEYFRRSFDVATSGGDEEDIAFANQHLGYFFFRTKDYDSAQFYMEVANAYGKRMNYGQLLVNTMEVLHSVAYEKQQYKKAYELYTESHVLEDSLLSLENVSLINSIQSEYEMEKREAENKTLQDQATIREEYIKTQSVLNTILIIGAVLLIISIIALLRMNRTRRAKNKIIQQDRDLIREQSTKLKELDNYKSTFFANIAHDFRAPISLIKGFINLIKTSSEELKEDTIEYVQMIDETADRLHKMTLEINSLIQLEEGRYQLIYTDLDISAFFGTISKVFRSSKAAGKVDFQYHINVPEKASINADHDALEKIVFNILGNAFKYNTTGSKVSLNILMEGAHLAIEVVDDGPGIVNDKLDKIFDRYYRTENSYQRAAGLGIGLSLAKELAILHGGSITARSIPNEETCFKVTLPLTPPQ